MFCAWVANEDARKMRVWLMRPQLASLIKITRIAERQEPCEAQGQDRKEGFFFCRRAARRSYLSGWSGLPERSVLFF